MQDVLEVALGGMPLTTTVEGLERYTVNLRYDRDFRENLEALREIIVPTPTGAQVPLGQLADVEVVRAPMGIKSEGAVPNAWIYVDVKGIDIGTYVQMGAARGQRGDRQRHHQAAQRLQHLLERPVRIHAARASSA